MPLLGFQKRFADAVANGAFEIEVADAAPGVCRTPPYPGPAKRQTIRAYRRDKLDPKAGDTLHLWTGLRQKGARKLGEVICLSVEPIRIWPSSGVVEFQGRQIGHKAKRDLATRDGFEDFEAIRQWFLRERRPYARDGDRVEPAGGYFSGLVIRW